jgi:hypothetical protein
MRLAQENAPDAVVAELDREREAAVRERQWAITSIVGHVEDALGELIAQRDGDSWDEDEPVPDDTELDEEDARGLLASAHEQCDQAPSFDDYWRGLPKPELWTAGLVRKSAQDLAGQHLKPAEPPSASEFNQRLRVYRREHLLPDKEVLEKVVRYEAHLSRQLHKDLHELQRLQALRQGKPVAAPIAIDIDVATGPESAPANGG